MQTIQNFYDLLRTAVSNGGADAKEYVAKEAQHSDELWTRFSANAALAAWGRDGIDRIVKIAIAGDSVKSKSVALTLLSILAKSGQLSAAGTFTFMTDQEFAKFLDGRINVAEIRPAARQALRELIMSLPDDDLLLPIGQSFTQLTMQATDLAQELVASLSAKWLHFGPPTLDKYERLIANHPNDEREFQQFFCTYPQFLDPMAVHVWSQPDLHGALIPDFVVRRADDSYLVIEIECPGKLLMTKDGRQSREVSHAEKQVLEYDRFLSDRITEARVHFPNYRRADCLVVVGLEKKLDINSYQHLMLLNSGRQNTKIVGFDWLLERAKSVMSNISEGRIEVTKKLRVI